MDRWRPKDGDQLEWEPLSEHRKNDTPHEDSDDEAEISSLQTWKHNLRTFINSRIASRIAILLCVVLLILQIRQYVSPTTRSPEITLNQDAVDWSRYAYVQYATEKQYLCNSIMIFESLSRLGSEASRVMLYPANWNPSLSVDSFESKLLLEAEAKYGVELVPVHQRHLVDVSSTWRDSFVKLLAFNQTRYDRVLSLDSDSTVLKSMDELFLLPDAPIAMPRAYWGPPHQLTSAIMVVKPSTFEFNRVMEAIQHREYEDFDMEIVNHLYGDSCLVIPHRRYMLLTGDFRRKTHARYLGSKEAMWDPKAEFDAAKFVHFSDWPYPKPWITPEDGQRADVEPKCTPSLEDDCAASKIWYGIYAEFRKRRLDVCGPALARPAGAGFG